jgi:3-keto-L-gulonate-6-phosphate decarboxylase
MQGTLLQFLFYHMSYDRFARYKGTIGEKGCDWANFKETVEHGLEISLNGGVTLSTSNGAAGP